MTGIDRISPTRRPDRPVWGWQRWRNLLFMHWPVPANVMRAAVPERFDLDLHDGMAYVGVVPFSMEGVRPRLVPEFAALRFLETNVRTYVVRNGEPGVYFFSLEAASKIAVAAARVAFSLPYHHARMDLRESSGVAHYVTTRLGNGVEHEVRYRIGERLGESKPGTLEHFFLERYLLFTERGSTPLKGQVHHVPYPVHRAEVLEVRDQLVAAAGLPAVSGLPVHAHYSPGVDVEVFALDSA
jgi:uncharacterized protein